MKPCKKCGESKPLTEFHLCPRARDGRYGSCKECRNSSILAKRWERIEHFRAMDRIRNATPERRLARERVATVYKAKHRVRLNAKVAVSTAVKKGKLQRQPCWVCGEKAVAHHPDYSRPLDVVWLCQAHHKQTHALVKAA